MKQNCKNHMSMIYYQCIQKKVDAFRLTVFDTDPPKYLGASIINYTT